MISKEQRMLFEKMEASDVSNFEYKKVVVLEGASAIYDMYSNGITEKQINTMIGNSGNIISAKKVVKSDDLFYEVSFKTNGGIGTVSMRKGVINTPISVLSENKAPEVIKSEINKGLSVARDNSGYSIQSESIKDELIFPSRDEFVFKLAAINGSTMSEALLIASKIDDKFYEEIGGGIEQVESFIHENANVDFESSRSASNDQIYVSISAKTNLKEAVKEFSRIDNEVRERGWMGRVVDPLNWSFSRSITESNARKRAFRAGIPYSPQYFLATSTDTILQPTVSPAKNTGDVKKEKEEKSDSILDIMDKTMMTFKEGYIKYAESGEPKSYALFRNAEERDAALSEVLEGDDSPITKLSVEFPLILTFDDYHEIPDFAIVLSRMFKTKVKGQEIGQDSANGKYIGMFYVSKKPNMKKILDRVSKEYPEVEFSIKENLEGNSEDAERILPASFSKICETFPAIRNYYDETGLVINESLSSILSESSASSPVGTYPKKIFRDMANLIYKAFKKKNCSDCVIVIEKMVPELTYSSEKYDPENVMYENINFSGWFSDGNIDDYTEEELIDEIFNQIFPEDYEKLNKIMYRQRKESLNEANGGDDDVYNPMKKEVEKELLKYWAGRLIFCPFSKKLMDAKKTVIFTVKKDSGEKDYVMHSDFWDQVEKSMIDLCEKEKCEHEILDGRKVFKRSSGKKKNMNESILLEGKLIDWVKGKLATTAEKLFGPSSNVNSKIEELTKDLEEARKEASEAKKEAKATEEEKVKIINKLNLSREEARQLERALDISVEAYDRLKIDSHQKQNKWNW
jgi:hypothetical protein